MTRRHSFGVSTHVALGSRLTRAQVLEIAAHGFEALELVAVRTHCDYRSSTNVSDLRAWMADAGLTLNSVHAPLGEGFSGGRWNTPLSLASTDASAREHAVAEAEAALQIARRIPFDVFVIHVGVPRWAPTAAVDNSRDAARRSVEYLAARAKPLGVRVAVEIILNELSRAGSAVHFVERLVEASGVGICLDFGHAHIDGDLVDAIETVSEHLIAIDLHDNQGRADDHLVPLDGSIDWPAALTAVQKVGYDGALMLELSARGGAKATLGRARQSREKLERMMAEV